MLIEIYLHFFFKIQLIPSRSSSSLFTREGLLGPLKFEVEALKSIWGMWGA